MPISGKVRIQIDEAAERGDFRTVIGLLNDYNPDKTPIQIACEENIVSAAKLILTSDYSKNVMSCEREWARDMLKKVSINIKNGDEIDFNIDIMDLLFWLRYYVPVSQDQKLKINDAMTKNNLIELIIILSSLHRETNDPLLIACACGMSDVVKYLLIHSSSEIQELWSDENYQYFLFMLAIMGNHTEVLDILLKSKRFNVNCRDKEGDTPLIAACNSPHPEVVRRLLQEPGIDINAATPNNPKEPLASNRTPLLTACLYGRNEIAMLLLNMPGINVNPVGPAGLTPLHAAGTKCDLAVVKRLINMGANLRAECDEDGMKPDEFAEKKSINKHTCKFIKIVRALKITSLSEGFRDSNVLPLFIAIMLDDNDTVKRLLAKEPALLNSVEGLINSTRNDTPLIRACRFGNLGAVKIILGMGYNPNLATQPDGLTALYVASQGGYADIVDCLLQAGANPNQASTDGDNDTPLIAASNLGHADIIALLLKKGANPGHVTAHGSTPLQLAEYGGHTKAYRLLTQALAFQQQTTALKENVNDGRATIAQPPVPPPSRKEQEHFQSMQRSNHAVLAPTASNNNSSAAYANFKNKKDKIKPQPAMVHTGHDRDGCCVM